MHAKHRACPREWGDKMYVGYRARGRLDVGALERAVTHVVACNAGLRASFTLTEDALVKTVAPPEQIAVNVVSMHGASDEEIYACTRELLRERLCLAEAPLIRAHVLRVSDDDAVVLIIIHHLIFDAGSYAAFFDALGAAYEAALERRLADSVERREVYEFARWQRSSLTDEVRERLAEYWAPRLRASTSAPPLVRDLPDDGACERAMLPFAVDDALALKLRATAGKAGIPLPALLCGAVCMTLGRAMRADAVSVRYLYNLRGLYNLRNRRSAVNMEGALGYFLNVLPLTLDVGRDLLSIAKSARDEMASACAYADVPVVPLVERGPYDPKVGVGREPFVAAFNFQRARSGLRLAGTTTTPLPREHIECAGMVPQRPQEWRLLDRSPGLAGLLVYDVKAWPLASARALVERLMVTLRELVPA